MSDKIVGFLLVDKCKSSSFAGSQLKAIVKNNSSLLWRDWDRMNPLPPMAGIWLPAIGDLNPAEPDTIGVSQGVKQGLDGILS